MQTRPPSKHRSLLPLCQEPPAASLLFSPRAQRQSIRSLPQTWAFCVALKEGLNFRNSKPTLAPGGAGGLAGRAECTFCFLAPLAERPRGDDSRSVLGARSQCSQ